MRHRLRAGLELKMAQHPEQPRWVEQLARVDTARICTLHGFCLQLLREHFHALDLDPDLTVLAQDQAYLLMRETLETLLREHLLGHSATDLAVQQWVLEVGRGRDRPLHELVMRLHHYSQTRADPRGWLEGARSALEQDEPKHWEPWLQRGFAEWRDTWIPELESMPPENEKAAAAAASLRATPDDPDRAAIATALTSIVDLDAQWPRGTKTKFRRPLEDFFSAAEFLHSLTACSGAEDPLTEDWQWSRSQVEALLGLTREFGQNYARAKRELGAVDFHDLEQFALDLLWDRQQQGPTELAEHWRGELDEILVDEYQDINAAQDSLIRSLGRNGSKANRFLVGDVKQSIYRFRLADPRIFQEYAHTWKREIPHCRVLSLTGNFRSQPGILMFVNRLFAGLMHPSLGGLSYTEDQWLRPGSESVASPQHADPSAPAVEFRILSSQTRGADSDGIADTDREARWLARWIQRLVRDATLIRDGESGALRPVTWGDVAILLRSPSTRSEPFVRAFAFAGVPLQIGRKGFYEALEVLDLLNLLQILDNPRQDIPLLAVLRSPFGGFSAEELAAVRITQRRGPVWLALRKFVRDGNRQAPAWIRAREFLEVYQKWRTLARVAPLSECLDVLLEDTAYHTWLGAQPAPDQARANLRRFLALTRQFDSFQRQGLHRFLRFVEAQQAAAIEPESATATPSDAVRLMSIHQSKGLEFPVVALADLQKRFNFADLHTRVILDEEYGLCPLVQPPDGRPAYPSLPHWLASQRQRREILGEELRLLYVACTRARDRLLLCGTATAKQTEEKWPNSPRRPTAVQLLAANNWLDWLGPWWTKNLGLPTVPTKGEPAPWTARVVLPEEDEEEREKNEERRPSCREHQETHLGQGRPTWAAADERVAFETLRSRLTPPYAHQAATKEFAKASVSALRSRARIGGEEEARVLFVGGRPYAEAAPGGLDPATRGTVHHRVLEALPLQHPVTQGILAQCVHELRRLEVLTPVEADALDWDALIGFWQSALGKRIQRQHKHVQRELPFTARFSPNELRQMGIPMTDTLEEDEYVVVQGVIDLAVVLPAEVWILDFKTDQISESELGARVIEYHPQLELYGRALEVIYRRPVRELWLHFLHLRRTAALRSSATGPQRTG
jgi:ATP-dependent helicase/nuclease subunit A